MPSTYSNLKIQLMATGENTTTWGDVTNTNLGTALEEAIANTADVTFASNNVTLTLSDTNGTQPARRMRLRLVGTTGGSARTLTLPNTQKAYIVSNTCGDAITVISDGGTGISVPAGKTMWLYNNGVNVVDVTTHLTTLTLGTPLGTASGGLGNNTGSGASLINLNASSVSSGLLAVTYGGTNASTAAGARANILPSYTGNAGKLLALNVGGTDVEWIAAGGAGTVTSVNAATTVSGFSFVGGPITASGTLTLTGTLGATSGGTGLTSPGTAGNVLTSNGSGWVSQAPTAGGGVASVSGSGSGISVSPTTGAVVVQNTGVTSITAGTGINVTASTGSITISATGGGGSGTFALNNGSISAPSLYFTSSSDTGMYVVQASSFTGSLNLAVDGLLGLSIHSPQSVSPNSLSLGYNAGAGFGSGSQNCTAIGFGTITTSTTGDGNTAVGSQALNKVTGTNNTGVGVAAGFNLSSGTNNTVIGYLSAPSSNTVSNEITLGNSSIATLRCQVTTITSLSDARDKKDITALDAGLDFINALNPVRFTWNMRPTEGLDGEMVEGRKDDPDTGFIAQDLKAVQEQLGITIPGLVYEVNPEKLEAGYGKLLPVLVKAIQELSAKVDALEAQLGG